MKALICFVLLLAAGALASAQTTPTPKKITDYPDLGAPIDSADWLLMHDTSANAYKRIGPVNLLASKQDTSGNLTSLANLVDPNGNRMLIWNDATNEFDYQTIPAGGSLSLTGRRIPYGDNAGGSTHEAGFEYDPTFNLLKVPTMVSIGDAAGGTAFVFTVDSSGGIQLFNDFTDEDLKLNLGVGGANTAFFISSSGVNLIDLGTIDLKVPTEAYDATNWNGDLTVPTKDAVRDKFESLAPSGGDVTAAAAFANDNRLIRSDGTSKGVQASGIIVDDSNNVSGVGSLSASSASHATATIANLNVDTVDFEDSDASHRTSLEFGSNLTTDRSLSVITGDADRILTVSGDATLNDWFNQSVKTTASPSFTNVTTGAEAYDATGWDGDNTVPTKNDVRDKIETLGGGSLTSTYVGYGSGGNALTGESVFNYNATTNTLTVPNVDSSSGTATVGPLKTSDGKHLLNDLSVYTSVVNGGDTAYTLTNTVAAVDNGADDPVLVIDSAGTYLIHVRALVDYSGATVAAETATIKLRRTNNTAGDVTNATTTIDLPVATTLTHTYGSVELPPVLYTTTNADDSLTIFANVSATLGAGSIKISEASIVAVRIR